MTKTAIENDLESSLIVLESIKRICNGIDNPNIGFALYQIKRQLKSSDKRVITRKMIRDWAKTNLGRKRIK